MVSITVVSGSCEEYLEDEDIKRIGLKGPAMRPSLFRAVSIIVLIIVAWTFTGLATSVSAALVEKAEKSCCDECGKGEGNSPDNCSTPDCPVFLCLSVNMVSSFMLPLSEKDIYISHNLKEQPLKSPPKSIFHPPRSV